MNVYAIIPVYNAESYVAGTIDSVLNQSYPSTKVLLVNDGSTDGSLGILRDYELKHKNVYVIDKLNGGVSSARNAGLEFLSTLEVEYFTFIDSDDLIDEGYIEAMVSQAEEYSADIVSSLVRELDGRLPLPVPVVDREWMTFEKGDALLELLYDGMIKNHSCAKIYRYSTCGHVRFNERIAIGEDMEYLSRVIDDSFVIRASFNQQYFYIQRPQSAMNSKFTLKRADSYFAAKMMSKRLEARVGSRKATQTKVFTEALSILSKVYPEKDKYEALYRECYNEVSKLASCVFKDRRARYGQRMYALLSVVSPRAGVMAVRIKSKKVSFRKPGDS